jgi:hypothetical protein
MELSAQEAVADVVRRMVEELDELPEGVAMREVILVVEVQAPDPEGEAEHSFTRVGWKTSMASTAHAVGMLTLALRGMVEPTPEDEIE